MKLSVSAAETLKEILSREKELYTGMISISEQMRDTLVEGDIQKLEGMIGGETELSNEIIGLERERLALGDALWGELGEAPEGRNLADLCERLGDPVLKGELIALRAELSGLLEKLRRLNAANEALLAQKKKYAGAMLGTLLRREQPGCFYDSRGSAGDYSPGAGLIDRQA